MKKILLDNSPTGVQHSVHVSDDELITIEHTPTAVEDLILESTAYIRNHMTPRKGAMFRHAARIPINTYMQWKREWREKYRDTYTWGEYEIIKLNSSDVAKLRTTVKRL